MITLAIVFTVGLTFGMFFGCALGVNSEKDKRIKDLENRLKEPLLYFPNHYDPNECIKYIGSNDDLCEPNKKS